MSMPSIRMRPCCGVWTRCSRLISVVLPAPVGPTIATVWPAFTSKDMSCDALPRIRRTRSSTSSKRTWPVTRSSSRRPSGSARSRGIVLEPVEVLELHARFEYLVDEGRHLVEPADQQGRKAGEGDDVADPQFAAATPATRRSAARPSSRWSRPGGAARWPAPTSRAPDSGPRAVRAHGRAAPRFRGRCGCSSAAPRRC